jgi:mono/diheme cytochrome c family protein/uncharacterized membrane protein
VVLAVLAELTLSRAGHGPDLALFVGRFHPLVVHLPIGFFLLVAAGEAATFHPKLRPRVEPALQLLLVVSAGAALLAFLMGQLLALEGGFPAEALGWHRRLTLLAVIGMAASWVTYDRARDERGRWVYRGVLATTLGVLSLGAHFGGTMTRGESYLAKYAPGPLQPLLGGAPKPVVKEPVKAAAPSAEPLIFQDVVRPILEQRCVECHGPEKQKGKLRLDSLEELMKGGENGAALEAGVSAKSALVTRMLLPLNDDDRMPPEGKPGPTPEEIALIRFWIDRGALPSLKVKDALAPTASRALLERIAGGAPAPLTPGATAPAAPSTPSASASPAPSASPTSASEPLEPAAAAAPPPSSGSSAAAPTAATEPAAAPPATAALSGAEVLATYCAKCHGAQKQRGSLRVDSIAAMVQGGKAGPALVLGSPEKSLIVTRARLPLDDDDHMPPPKAPQPSAAEIATLAQWVRSASKGTAPSAKLAPVAAAAATSEPEPEAAPLAPSASGPATEPASAPAPAPAARTAQAPVDFATSVQPLLRDKCGKCHIRESPAGGLSVANHADLLSGGFTGPAIAPRDHKSSLLARVQLAVSDDEHMPPEGEAQLTPDEIALLSAWIDQGAPAAASAASPGQPPAPPALATKSGGCAACSVPGAPRSRWLEVQSWSAFAAMLFLTLRRRKSSASSRQRRRH